MAITKTAALFLLSLAILPGQQRSSSCNQCSAESYRPGRVSGLFEEDSPHGSADQQVRAVDVGRSYVAVGIVYRDQTQNAGVAEHDLVSEVYYVIDGSGTLVTGQDIVGWKARPADNKSVKLLNGPGGDGASIRNGKTFELKAGDSVIIPARRWTLVPEDQWPHPILHRAHRSRQGRRTEGRERVKGRSGGD